jgi:farnesyl-diphosphate farnesyltransferase
MISVNLNKENVRYLDIWMNKVSRSFAVVVASLEEPLKFYMSASYIICRVIDNIEDCLAVEEWKSQRFAEVSQLLIDPSQAENIFAVWDEEEWPGLSQDEWKLMKSPDGLELWRIFAGFPEQVQSVIRYWSLQMADGMGHLQEPASRPRFVNFAGVELLEDVQDYNQYCYVVAGTVGHLATELVIQHYRLPGTVADILLRTCEACGRGLQKTNIVKDFPEDLTRGISYLPDAWLSEVDHSPLSLSGAPGEWKYKVLADVLADLRDATEYTLALPYEATGYRMASLLCLLPALQTLLFAAQRQQFMFTQRHPTKISHQTFAQCIFDAKRLVKSNDGIIEYFRKIENKVELQFAVA